MNIPGLPTLLTRVTAASATVDLGAGTADIVAMRGNAITRRYGAERVRLSRSAVITDRLRNGCGVQLLDSHSTRSINSALGKVTSLRIERGALRAGVKFHETDEAREAIEMLADGEISSVSAAYAVADLEILDCHGRLVDPCDSERSTESDLIFEATRFELYELSLVRGDLDVDTTDLADRAYTSPVPIAVADVHARMCARQAVVIDNHQRQSGPRMRREVNVSIFHHRRRDAGAYRRITQPPAFQVRPPET